MSAEGATILRFPDRRAELARGEGGLNVDDVLVRNGERWEVLAVKMEPNDEATVILRLIRDELPGE